MKSDSQINAILTDGGHIMFEDSVKKNEFFSYLEKKGILIKTRKIFSVKLSFGSDINLEARLNLSKGKLEPSPVVNALKKYAIKSQIEENYNRRMAYKDALNEIGYGDLYEDLLNHFKHCKKNKEILIPEVKKVFTELSNKGKKIIILTDSSLHGVELKEQLKKMGYGDEITDIISSKDVGVRKPHINFFNAALEKYNLNKDETIFLGHDVDELVGAYNLGFKTVAFRYKLKDLNELSNIDYKIDKPSELLDIVEGKK